MADADEGVTALLPDLEPVRLLAPDGTLVEHPDHPLDLATADIVAMYRAMKVTRAVDQEFMNLQRQGQAALYAPCRGQEAAQVGSAWATDERDFIFPQYRELGVAVVRGVDLVAMGHTWRGSWHSELNPVEQQFGALSVPLATQMLHAVGYAMGVRFDGDDAVVVTYFGDGASSEGDAHEALNFGAVFEVPIVFFLQNNQWAISTPLHDQTRAPSLAHKGIGYGIPSVRCDGNDVLASYVVMREAVARARAGGGPTLIEAVTFRHGPHTTSDDPTRYRSDEEVEHWERLDPLSRLETMLTTAGELDDDTVASIDADALAATTAIRDALFDAADTSPLEVFEHVYTDPPATLVRQRQELANELADHHED